MSSEGKILWTKDTFGPSTSSAISTDGLSIAYGAGDNTINFVRSDGSLLWKQNLFEQTDGIAVTNNGGYIVAGTADNTLHVFNSLGTEQWQYAISGRVQDIRISDDGAYFVVGTRDGKIYFFNINGIPPPVILPVTAALVVLQETTIPTTAPAVNMTSVQTDPDPQSPLGKLNPGLLIGVFVVVLVIAVGAYKYLYLPSKKPPKTIVKTTDSTDLIFISTKSEDYPYANQLYSFLTAHGYNVFFSEQTLSRSGNCDYRKEIDRALERAKHMIVVTSRKEYVEAPWVEFEWGGFINEKNSGRKTGTS